MKNSLSKLKLIADLEMYQPSDVIEHKHRVDTMSFLKTSDNPFFHTNKLGHITASAILLNPDKNSVLLFWHEKLNRWLQPGGHCEKEDLSVEDASFRELLEETQIKKEFISAISENSIFDIDVHQIPERNGTPSHIHYDLRYLFVLSTSVHLSASYSWINLAKLADHHENSLSRFAQKLLSSK